MQMELHVAEKPFLHATILLLLTFFAHTDSKPLWLWTEGCNEVTVHGTVYNISGNSPVACFQSCDGETSSIALKDNRCVCQFDKKGSILNNDCSVKCPGDDITMCGSQKTKGWSVYTKADESEVKAKKIPLNMTGCVTVRPIGGYVYHVQPCNFSLAYSLCENYVRKCNSGFYYPAPNWTFACGYRTRHPFDGRYPIRFSKTEECISSDFSISKDKQFWIGLFALETKEPTEPTISSTNDYEYSSLLPSDTLDYLSYIEPSLTDIRESSTSILDYLSSVHLTPISPTSINVYGSTILISSFDKFISTTEQTSISSAVKVSPTTAQSLMTSFNIGYTAEYSLTTSLPSTHVLTVLSQNNTHSDKTHSTTSVPNANSSVTSMNILPSSSSRLYQTTAGTSPLSKFSSSTTPFVEPNPSRNEGKQDEVSTITSITAGAAALCLLIAVIGLAVYVRKHTTKQANLGSSNFSDIGHHSEVSMKTFTNVFTDEKSQQIIRSVIDDQNQGMPNMTRSTRADLSMSNNTLSGHSSIGNRARENEYVFY